MPDRPLQDKSNSPLVETLTPQARELADLAGITPVIQDLDIEQKFCNAAKDKALSLPLLARRQKLMYLREKLNTMIQAANLQINSTKGKIDSATAQADESRAFLTEQRNRVTHRNSQVNLLSGGVTKIVGYGIALADLSPIPTNVLEVFDGSVQSTLSTLALREERKEGRLEHGMPPILSAFLDGNPGTHFASSVWHYLNDVPVGDSPTKQSRRQLLIANWQKTGMMTRATGLAKANGRIPVTVDLLDQRLAMLSDVNSVVAHMHAALMSLSDAIVASYARDPDFGPPQ